MMTKIGYAALACLVAVALLTGSTPEWAGRIGGGAALAVLLWPRRSPKGGQGGR